MALELSDARMGAEVRKMIKQYPQQFDNDVMCCTALATILAGLAHKMNGVATLRIPELFFKGKNVGAFIVTASPEKDCENEQLHKLLLELDKYLLETIDSKDRAGQMLRAKILAANENWKPMESPE